MIEVLLLVCARSDDALTQACTAITRGTSVTYKPTGEKVDNWYEIAFTGSPAEVELVVYRFTRDAQTFMSASDAYAFMDAMMGEARPVPEPKLTESEFYAQVWAQKFRELKRLGCITPVASATTETDEYMRRLNLQGDVPWVND